jgi:imidazolonepropionase-like amidohydrolase
MHLRKSWSAVLALLAVLFISLHVSAQDSSANREQATGNRSDQVQSSSPTDEINIAAAASTWKAPAEVVVRNAKIMTVTHGTIPNGSILIRNGKFVEAGPNVNASPNAKVIDAGGKIVTPGIIDSHSHMALDDDVNEWTSPIVPHMKMLDAFNYTDKAIYRALAGGVTTSLLLHGSADMIGGQGLIIKTKYGLDRDDLIVPKQPRNLKFASGENPKRVFGSRNQLPSTRMGNFEVLRDALEQGKEYLAEQKRYQDKVARGDKDATPPKRDLKLDAIGDLLQGKLVVQNHCYRADEFLTEMSIAKEYGFKIRSFAHALEAYKVADKIAAEGVGITTFADWWGYKYEAWDAIPWNAVMCMRKGVTVAIKSDSNDFMRRLNQEAAKTIRYGGATPDEALRMITLNAAWQFGMEDRLGSIDPGKDADLVIWDGDPLSVYGIPNKVIIEGEVFFDRSLPGLGLTHWREGQW